MRRLIIKRLFDSFAELDRAISSAKLALERKENAPQEILNRINAYSNILEKQRALATSLCGHANLGNWDEVARHVKIINGLSAMIRDDAREIVSNMKPKKPTFISTGRELMLS